MQEMEHAGKSSRVFSKQGPSRNPVLGVSITKTTFEETYNSVEAHATSVNQYAGRPMRYSPIRTTRLMLIPYDVCRHLSASKKGNTPL